jgi:membrane fusion protein (multidrug efflux system)
MKKITRNKISLIVLIFTSVVFLSYFYVNAQDKIDDNFEQEVENYVPDVKIKEAQKIVYEETVNFAAIAEPIVNINIFPEANGKISAIYAKEGTYVRKGQLLAQIEADETLIANLNSAQANLDVAEDSAETTEKLYKQLKKDADGTDSEKVAKRQYDLYVDSADGQVDIAQRQVDYVQAQLSNYAITASANGILNVVNFKVGDTVSTVSSFGTIVVDDKISIKSGVSDEEIIKIQPNQRVKIKTDLDKEEFFEGKVVSVGVAPDELSRKFPVEIELKNPEIELKPGIVVHIFIIVDEIENALIVPKSAVFNRLDKDFIYVLKEGNLVELREVEINNNKTTSNNEELLILRGLKEGESFIVNAKYDLKDGDQVMAVLE